MLEKLAKDDAEKYQTFWQQFGLVLKKVRRKISLTRKRSPNCCVLLLPIPILLRRPCLWKVRFPHERRAGKSTISPQTATRRRGSPHLELLRKKGIEVLLLSDRIDEWMMNYLTEFDGKPFQSVSKVDESLEKLADEVDESAKEAEKALTPFIDRVRKPCSASA